MKRYTVAADGSVTVNAEEASFTDIAVDAIISPINALSSSKESELVTAREAGIYAATHLVVGGALGEAWGNKRARSGKKPLLSFLG